MTNDTVTEDATGSTSETSWNLDRIVGDLRQARAHWRERHLRYRDSGAREFPSRDVLRHIVADLCGVLFPMRLGPQDLRQEDESYYVGYTLNQALNALVEQAQLELALKRSAEGNNRHEALRLVRDFAEQLPAIRAVLDTDVEAAYQGDPAAQSVDEVLLCYPGVHAMILHRIAHTLYSLNAPLLARIVAEISHADTGIDIHPGAIIGKCFFIDHGTGVVIGETAVIGERVRIYQAVTLGAKRFSQDENGVLHKGDSRHPIVEDDVVIYAGATILGRITIGRGSSIGGNVWVTHSVPPGSRVTQANSRQEIPGSVANLYP